MYMFTTLKKRNFIELVIKKFASLPFCSSSFVTKYLVDLQSCSTACLDVIINICAKEEHILVKILTDHLESNNCVLDANTRYILEKLTFTFCQPVQQLTYRELLDKLECVDNATGADFKLIVRVLKCCSDALFKRRKIFMETDIPNLFHHFKYINSVSNLDALADFLTDDPFVINSFIFYDAIYNWLYDQVTPMGKSYEVADSFIEKYSAAFEMRGWNPLPREYVNRSDDFDSNVPWLQSLTAKILNERSTWADEGYYRFVCADSYSPDDMFSRNHNIFIEVESEESSSKKKGKSGLILRVTAAAGNYRDESFNIQLVTDHRQYPDDVKLNEEFMCSIQHCHLTFNLEQCHQCIPQDTPVSWYGRPHLDATGKFWCWGPRLFFLLNLEKGNLPQDEECCSNNFRRDARNFYASKVTKIRPVVYIIR